MPYIKYQIQENNDFFYKIPNLDFEQILSIYYKRSKVPVPTGAFFPFKNQTYHNHAFRNPL